MCVVKFESAASRQSESIADRMLRRCSAIVVLSLITATMRASYAEDPEPNLLSTLGQASNSGAPLYDSEARIRITCANPMEVEDKLKSVFELSPDPKLTRQWKKLTNDFLDVFTEGMDITRPISVDVVFAANELAYDYRVPLPISSGEPSLFLEALRGRSLKVRKLTDHTYEILEKGKPPAHMRIEGNYAWIATGDRPIPTIHQLRRDGASTLGPVKEDIVAEVHNDETGIATRRSTFDAFRKKAETHFRPLRNESKPSFERRKVMTRAALIEAERVLVEAKDVLVSATIRTAPQHQMARADLKLEALPDTDLWKLVEQFGTSPSHFVNVPPRERCFADLRLCIPLDAIRIQNLKELLGSLRPILTSEIEGSRAQHTGPQSEASIRALNIVFDLLEESAELRQLDTFAELFENEENRCTLLVGARIAGEQKIDELVNLIPSCRPGWTVKLNALEHANVRIHELTVGEQDLPLFQTVFQNERVFHIGVGKGVVWAAAGNGSLGHLKAVVDQTSQTQSHKSGFPVASCRLRPGKLLPLIESSYKQFWSRDIPLTQEEKQLRKETELHLKLAREAMVGCESIVAIEVRKGDHQLVGSLELNECVLKSIGSLLGNMMYELK